ncbi:MAG: thioredoxin family protein [Defluviitaleaceae bacterium]|nr:thioredoxin family protein [Defluviitaleaceae bacterium]
MIDVDKDTFAAEVLEGEGKILVDFYGDGCVPCEAIMPFVMECAQKYGGQLKFVKLNTSKARRLSISQKILGLPVIAIYHNGEKLEELVKDDATEANITAMIERHL